MTTSRPTTLYQYENQPQPEKEPLQFDVQLKGAPEEIVQLVHNIKQVGEQFLYHWKTFPIVLPPPANAAVPSNGSADLQFSSGDAGRYQNSLSRKGGVPGGRPPNLRDLFITPSFDELDAVAIDGSGEPRRLTGKQLDALRERGEFEVPSLNFPGQNHKWQLSPLLQRGVENTYDTLLSDLALALRFIIVTAKARLVSHFFSVAQALSSLVTGLIKFLDILVGVPSLQAVNLEAKLREERSRYLVAELLPTTEYEDCLESLCIYIRRQLRRAATEKFEFEKEASHLPVPIPYLFHTPKGYEVDLRLFSKDIMKKAFPILVAILERETRGWFLHFREKLISELRQQKKPDEEIEKEVNEAVMKEYLDRVFSGILLNSDLQSLGPGIPQLLVDHAQAVVLMHRAVENMTKKLEKTKSMLKERLEYTHPVCSRINPWMRDRLRAAEERFIEECKWSAHEEALSLCTNQHLNQTVYFLHRDLTFMKEREPVLKYELRSDKSPTRVFYWRTHIWMPSNWIVRRSFQGHSEIIPTVLSTTATSITTPRSDPSQPVFLVEKEIVRSTTTRWPLWRWINYCHRTWSWTWNAMFFFGVVMPWCSPVGIRALLCASPFTPDLELSQVNGTLFPRQSSATPTMLSTLRALARHVSKATSQFESKPDTGFIGKGMTRQINKLWNYIGKGVFGTLGILLIFPPLCILSTGLSLVIAATAFFWMPCLTLALQVGMGLVWDIDCPAVGRNRAVVLMEALFLDVFLRGLLQPIAAIFLACVLCPLLSFIVLAVGVMKFGLRLAWDAVVFHLVIKKRGRVPASDSFIVKRIAGPGLNTNYYYQIRPEQALAAFEAKLEQDELSAYQHQMEIKILQPQKDFSQFVTACFGPFSATLARVGAYKRLEREGQDLVSTLHEKLERRRRDLQPPLPASLRPRLKLSNIDLKVVIQQGAVMLERFYPTHVLSRLSGSEQEFWDSKGLTVNDWPGLAASLFSDIFSLDFLAPLDESDTSFKLDCGPGLDLSRYRELVRGAGGVDLLGHVYAPRANIQVNPPFLDVAAFNPRSCAHSNTTKSRNTGLVGTGISTVPPGPITLKRDETLWRPWKRPENLYSAEKLLIPLPIPHPVQIAVTIYNRDSDNPIPLDNQIATTILRALEEGSEDAVGRYRGGGDDESLGSSVASSSCGSAAAAAATAWPDCWATARPRHVCVDLASPEDITLDSDSTRVGFSYGTTV